MQNAICDGGGGRDKLKGDRFQDEQDQSPSAMTAAKKTSSHPASRKSTRKAIARQVAELDPQQFDRIAKALADPTRFAMLERIAGAGEIACMDLADHCEVTPATVSHHLKELVYAGLVDARREAKFMIHTLRRDVWTAYLRELAKRIPAEG